MRPPTVVSHQAPSRVVVDWVAAWPRELKRESGKSNLRQLPRIKSRHTLHTCALIFFSPVETVPSQGLRLEFSENVLLLLNGILDNRLLTKLRESFSDSKSC